MNCQQVMLVGEASGVATGLLAAQELKPDLVLLDTSLKDGSGFDFLKLLHSVDFKIIFISANDQAAFKAFKFNPVDYLLKPVNPLELAAAVKRAEILSEAICRKPLILQPDYIDP
jgi:two-component system, LytTR family, response regulator